MMLLFRQVGLGATVQVAVPAVRQEQAPGQRTAGRLSGGGDRNTDLTVADLARSVRVLPGHADGVAPGLGQAGVVHYPGKWGHFLAHAQGQLPSDRFPSPGALVQKLLKTLLITVRKTGAHRFDRLAPAVAFRLAPLTLSVVRLADDRLVWLVSRPQIAGPHAIVRFRVPRPSRRSRPTRSAVRPRDAQAKARAQRSAPP